MFEKIMDKLIWTLIAIGGVLTIEEAVSVAYVGIPASHMVCNIALGCLVGSVVLFLITGTILGIREALVK